MKTKIDKSNHIYACLKAWADATVENLVQMEQEGKSTEYRGQYLRLSAILGQHMEAFLYREGNVNRILEMLDKMEARGKVKPT